MITQQYLIIVTSDSRVTEKDLRKAVESGIEFVDDMIVNSISIVDNNTIVQKLNKLGGKLEEFTQWLLDTSDFHVYINGDAATKETILENYKTYITKTE